MTDWMDEANCATTSPELFFPPQGDNGVDAKAVCGSCRVAEQCLEYALTNDYHDGVYGGLTPNERRRLAQPKVRT